VVVSHEPWLSHEICTGPQGELITPDNERQFNLFQMNYDSIRQCDCGLKPHPRFPAQQRIAAHKPVLEEVLLLADAHAAKLGRRAPRYNIELKVESTEAPWTYNPPQAEFAARVMEVLNHSPAKERCNLQSFDLEMLRVLHRNHPEMPLALLIEHEGSLSQNLDSLGFVPQLYSPDHILVDEELVKEVHERGMKLVPWTVNDSARLRQLVSWGVDGIITDDPTLARSLR
jgi:glycerophosphoryl diester phosphodiesterase